MRWLLAALAGAALLTGCGIAVPGTAAPESTPVVPLVAPAGVQVPDPASINIPAISALSSLVPTARTASGGWEVPPLNQPMQASWFQPGPEPGEPGPAVILGHVNGQHREGVFARLHELAPGDRIDIVDVTGSTREFEVTSVDRLPKDQFDSERVMPPTPDPRLYLITCGGELEHTATGGRYLDNWIVAARPV
jgi:hypothetical protein